MAARKTEATVSLMNEKDWLRQVREVRHPLDPTHPLRVRTLHALSGEHLQPTQSYPERHPYCEISFVPEGRGEVFIGTEKMEASPGVFILIGPGMPHYGRISRYPNCRFIVHFLPILLFEMSPVDGARILTRFTASQPIAQRIIQLPKALQPKFAGLFKDMAEEFDHPRFGSDLSTRTRLMDALIALIRWEESVGKGPARQSPSNNWDQIEKILNFIYKHYSEPLYIQKIAREVGLNVKDLRKVFHNAFGMSCVQYLTAYRVSHAASLLCVPGARVTEVAPAVGFETFSHFNLAFRRFQGMSPTEYMRSHKTGK